VGTGPHESGKEVIMSDPERQRNVPAGEELPLPGYDELPLGTLTHRVRTLDTDAVEELLAYERGHANRLPVVSMLEARLTQLREGAQPSGGSPHGTQPEQASDPTDTEPASPQTQGPPVNPPSQGVPTNPRQQPRRPT
jgi:hypothetical protein